MDRGLISEKTEGLKCKICKTGPRVDFKETQVHQSSPAGAQQREERTGCSARASLGLGWRRGGRAMAVKAQRCRCSVRRLLRHGERGNEAGRGAVKLGEGARLL
jgi:hypothetical protein